MRNAHPTRTPVPFEEQPNSALVWQLLQDNIRIATDRDVYHHALTLIAQGVNDPTALARIVLENQEPA